MLAQSVAFSGKRVQRPAFAEKKVPFVRVVCPSDHKPAVSFTEGLRKADLIYNERRTSRTRCCAMQCGTQRRRRGQTEVGLTEERKKKSKSGGSPLSSLNLYRTYQLVPAHATYIVRQIPPQQRRGNVLFTFPARNAPLTLLKKTLALHGTRCNLAAAQAVPSGTPCERCKSGRAG